MTVAIDPVSAQNGDDAEGGGGALGDVIVWAIEEAIRVLFGPIEGLIERYGNEAVEYIVGTPHPNAVFSAPTNNAWPSFYAYFWDTLVPLSLVLWALMIGIVILLESMSYLFSSYHRAKLKRRAFTGLLGILGWWWMDALARQFIHELTVFLAPDLSNVGLFETISFGAIGTIGVAVTMSVDFALLAIVLLIYIIREVVLYLFTLLMPLLIVFWIPGVGPFALVSNFMRRLAGFYVPFLFMTVPVALFFRIGALLGENFGLSGEGFVAWLIALVLPLAAILSPFVLFWQAGAILFTADRMASHTSSQQAKDRASEVKETAQSTSQSGQNFSRGVRGTMAKTSDGQYLIDSGQSRAHSAGSRLRSAGSKLRSGIDRSSKARDSSTTNEQSGSEADGSSPASESSGSQSEASPTTSERSGSQSGSSSASSEPSQSGTSDDSSAPSEQSGSESSDDSESTGRPEQFDALLDNRSEDRASTYDQESNTSDTSTDESDDDERPRYIN